MPFKGPFRRRPPQREEPYKVNQLIKAPMVRLVGENIETGIVSLRDALAIAEEQGLDLVEISPTANPPVCKVVDYRKFLYDKKKKAKEQKANSTKIVVKELRLSPNTDDHDFNFKLKHAINFLQEGSKVKVDVFFRGRSIVYKEQGEIILLRFANELAEYGKVESLPKLEGKRMIMIIAPKK
ncbi:MAG: translation initiation factor IF-3 [Bacteroidetes bacterium GWF2_43_63]|nr:MAG: translation initiation factor IF-3 [Bacteroidetes bacterium GWE2_42_42]OFY53910.1 MAG: translation initiation factor IF-3 [Bacteroidetes bacterium GWF2_43_63]HBG69846.1 translation initiation factor IF-3 [Bacteroidales bacterium]HCB60957.1 translation initiation factor IF-3 [Bacteroidales bacterium]HCY24513.1 translation initiation factor IF-3 [Bacteroidales bacterium]